MKLLVVVVNYQLMQGETAQPIHMALSIFMLSIWPMKDVAKCSSDGSFFFWAANHCQSSSSDGAELSASSVFAGC